jgi:hypothetical protein
MAPSLAATSEARRAMTCVKTVRRALSLLVALGALALPAHASAASIAISTSADPVEDVTYQVTLSGSTESDRYVYAAIKPAGGRPCASGQSGDDGDEFASSSVQGSYSKTYNLTTRDSGDYVLCAWLQNSSSDPTAVAATTKALNVRVPHSAGSVQVPAQVKAGKVFQVGVTAQTEVDRYVYATVNSPGVPCGANYTADDDLDTLFSEANQGGPNSFVHNFTAPSRGGVYTVCGWIQEGSSDTVPESTFSGQFTVLAPPSAACVKARKRVKSLTASAAQHSAAAKHLTAKRKKAHGKRRRKKLAKQAAGERAAAKKDLGRLAGAKHDVGKYCPA